MDQINLTQHFNNSYYELKINMLAIGKERFSLYVNNKFICHFDELNQTCLDVLKGTLTIEQAFSYIILV